MFQIHSYLLPVSHLSYTREMLYGEAWAVHWEGQLNQRLCFFFFKVIISAGTSKHNLNPYFSNKSQESIKPRVFHIRKYLLSFEPIITYFIIVWSQICIHNSHPEELTIYI